VRKPASIDSGRDTVIKAVGYILLNWSMLEQAVFAEIRRLRLVDGDSGATTVRARGSFNERLAEWRALVSLKARRNPQAVQEVADIASCAERFCRIRNLVAHHFAGVEQSDTGEWVVLVSESGASSMRAAQTAFTLRQLTEWNQQMLEACGRTAQLEAPVAR
jgi:hypothetical protein